MWLEEADEFFKGYLPYYILIFLPVFILISPINPVVASHEFPVYRMQHYDLHGVAHGCRSAGVNLEARTLTSWSSSRHCVIAKLEDLSMEHFRNIRSKAGALIIVLPGDLSHLDPDTRKYVMAMESMMLSQETSIPVYFVHRSPELELIEKELSLDAAGHNQTRSAAEEMFSSIAANGYQIVVSPGSANVKTDVKIATLQGQLIGRGSDGNAPKIAIVAHYDSFGVAPELANGADSNGSGVAILLELVRIFSTLYSNSKTYGKYNIVFLLTGGGKINYQGTKKWLEDQLDSLEGSIIQDASYVMCLDTLGASNFLYMHVSKPPKEGSPAAVYFKEMKVFAEQFPAKSIEGIHKKINLADDMLAWEHERFSIRRLPAFTLSSLKNHKDNLRATILDTRESLNVEEIVQNSRIIAEALASQIYNISGGNILGGSLDISEEHIRVWLDYLSVKPRSPQLLASKDDHLVNTLKTYLNKYLANVKVSYVVPDKRDPDFLFYDVTKTTMNVYSVKPAVFDLFLTLGIVGYLGLIYLFVQNFPTLYTLACILTAPKKTKST